VELFQAVAAGKIRALWIMATNPAVSLPEADRVAAALARCPFVVVSDCVRHTDTARHAHVRLPALAWGEKEGTVTNSERRISRQRAFLPAPGEARPDWWILAQVAQRMGFAAQFRYTAAAQVFREHAALSALENGGRRDLDLGALAALPDPDYDRLRPVQWPLPASRPQGTARLFGDGRFFTADGRARFVAVQPRLPEPATASPPALVLNTGRTRDQWHTMTRTGRSPRLASHAAEPVCAIHPLDAHRLGLKPGELVRVASPLGAILVPCALDEGQQPGSVFVPIHWNGRNSRRARVGALIPARVDPISGQPAFKHAAAWVERVEAAWYGFALSRRPMRPRSAAYWTVVQGRGHRRLEMAGLAPVRDWAAWARRLLGATGKGREAWIEYADSAAARYRGALLRNGRLEGCVFVAPHPHLPPRAWLGELIASGRPAPAERGALLTGRPGNGESGGRLVCSCFGIDAPRIAEAVRQGGLKHPRQVGAALKAGTNCGSCIPEIQALIEAMEREQTPPKQARTS
jgi:assimilatory nitrate reductase catalytic subunit